jgi:hypothetical protein
MKSKRTTTMSNSPVAAAKSLITFHVFRKDGSRNPDITRYFLENMIVTAQDALEGRLVLQDRTEWTIVLEVPVKKALQAADNANCLVSFQARVSGNYAVCRLFDEKLAAQKGKR